MQMWYHCLNKSVTKWTHVLIYWDLTQSFLHDVTNDKRPMCHMWFAHNCALATGTNVLETVHGAVRRLEQFLNCAFQCHYRLLTIIILLLAFTRGANTFLTAPNQRLVVLPAQDCSTTDTDYRNRAGKWPTLMIFNTAGWKTMTYTGNTNKDDSRIDMDNTNKAVEGCADSTESVLKGQTLTIVIYLVQGQCHTLLRLLRSQLYLWGSPFFGGIFVYVTIY